MRVNTPVVLLTVPLSVQVPGPLFTKPPVEFMLPEMTPAPTPARVSAFAPLFRVPESVRVPESEAMVPAAASVRPPERVLFPAKFTSAPVWPPKPEPEIVIGSAKAVARF